MLELLPINVEYQFVDSILKSFDSFDINSCDVILLDCAENRATIAKAISESGFQGIVFYITRNGIEMVSV